VVGVGDKAPDFILKNQDGEDVPLNSLTGNWVVLYFYPKDNTSGCTKEAIDFTALQKDFEAAGAVILGVSPDSIERHRDFISKHALGITLLSNPDRNILTVYGAWGEKKNYGKVTEGVIRSTFIISPTGIIKALWRKVRVRVKRKSGEVRHADIVLERLRELQDF
jgi:peroxiredoxin Q/BCP